MTEEIQEIPGMDLDRKYAKVPAMPENTEKIQKEMDKTKKELEKLKIWIIKKYHMSSSTKLNNFSFHE